MLSCAQFSRRWWRHIAITGRTDFQNIAKCDLFILYLVFVKKQRTIKRKKKRSKISGLESCYANRIYVLIGGELRPYGQKLVQFCINDYADRYAFRAFSVFLMIFFPKHKGQTQIERSPKGSRLESCYVKKIYGTFGVEMRAYGQKLVKFCKHTHTHTRLL